MHPPSVAALKNEPGRGGRVRNKYPDPSSKGGKLLALLMENKGRTVTVEANAGKTRYQVGRLNDFYGVDIRSMGPNKWCLVGEWFGIEYVDYLAEELAREGRDAR